MGEYIYINLREHPYFTLHRDEETGVKGWSHDKNR